MSQDTLNINQQEKGNIHYKILEISKGKILLASLIIFGVVFGKINPGIRMVSSIAC